MNSHAKVLVVIAAASLGIAIGLALAFLFMHRTAPTDPGHHAEVRTLFYSNIDLDPIGNCDVVFPVERTVSFASAEDAHNAEGRAAAVLTELFAGPTAEEERQGFSSFFSSETSNLMRSVHIEGSRERIAYIDLQDLRHALAGANSSCGSLSFFAQVEHTMRATAGVSQIRYAFDGDPEMFYDWMQIGCDATTDHCDPEPFR